MFNGWRRDEIEKRLNVLCVAGVVVMFAAWIASCAIWGWKLLFLVPFVGCGVGFLGLLLVIVGTGIAEALTNWLCDTVRVQDRERKSEKREREERERKMKKMREIEGQVASEWRKLREEEW